MSDKELEEGLALRLDFVKLRKIASGQADVIPAVAQDAQTGEVLILGYVNELALQTALREKKACGICTRMPAPSPSSGSAPTAPR